MEMNPYLGFNGNCQAAFKFYEAALGGKIVAMITYAETPMAAEMPADWRGKIIHARMTVGDRVLMGSDAPPDRYQQAAGMSVCFSLDQPAEAERVFKALSDGAKVEMPIAETFWAQRFGMLTDRFGVPWMINCERPDS